MNEGRDGPKRKYPGYPLSREQGEEQEDLIVFINRSISKASSIPAQRKMSQKRKLLEKEEKESDEKYGPRSDLRIHPPRGA